MARNEAWVSVVRDHDTPAFAVASIRHWWRKMGRRAYPNATTPYITADVGGSNGYRSRAWKHGLQPSAPKNPRSARRCRSAPASSRAPAACRTPDADASRTSALETAVGVNAQDFARRSCRQFAVERSPRRPGSSRRLARSARSRRGGRRRSAHRNGRADPQDLSPRYTDFAIPQQIQSLLSSS